MSLNEAIVTNVATAYFTFHFTYLSDCRVLDQFAQCAHLLTSDCLVTFLKADACDTCINNVVDPNVDFDGGAIQQQHELH